MTLSSANRARRTKAEGFKELELSKWYIFVVESDIFRRWRIWIWSGGLIGFRYFSSFYDDCLRRHDDLQANMRCWRDVALIQDRQVDQVDVSGWYVRLKDMWSIGLDLTGTGRKRGFIYHNLWWCWARAQQKSYYRSEAEDWHIKMQSCYLWVLSDWWWGGSGSTVIIVEQFAIHQSIPKSLLVVALSWTLSKVIS